LALRYAIGERGLNGAKPVLGGTRVMAKAVAHDAQTLRR